MYLTFESIGIKAWFFSKPSIVGRHPPKEKGKGKGKRKRNVNGFPGTCDVHSPLLPHVRVNMDVGANNIHQVYVLDAQVYWYQGLVLFQAEHCSFHNLGGGRVGGLFDAFIGDT
jgi:hypothetical protein